MARVPYLDQDQLEPAHRDLLERNLNLYRALVHSPDSARQFLALGMHIRHHMALDARLRELAIIQVGYQARAPYEYAHHIEIGRGVGVSDDDLRAIARESNGERSELPDAERAVLALAREMVAGSDVGAAAVARLDGLLDHAALIDLVLTIAFYCAVVRVLGTLDIELEAGYDGVLEQFPLPPA